MEHPGLIHEGSPYEMIRERGDDVHNSKLQFGWLGCVWFAASLLDWVSQCFWASIFWVLHEMEKKTRRGLGFGTPLSVVLSDANLQLLFTVVENAPFETVRSNCIVALGDLAVRFSNLLEPWTEHMEVVARVVDYVFGVRMLLPVILPVVLLSILLVLIQTSMDVSMNVPHIHIHEKWENEDQWHGAEIQIVVERNWTTPKSMHYMRQMAVITPYAQFLFQFISDSPEKNVLIRFTRRTDIMPSVPLETKHYPSDVDILLIKWLITETSKHTLLQFSFSTNFEEIGRSKFNPMIGLGDHERRDEALYDDFETAKAREKRLSKEARVQAKNVTLGKKVKDPATTKAAKGREALYYRVTCKYRIMEEECHMMISRICLYEV
ncbi:hypothetical protein MTR67_030908 [Solanum verrucosum]|uniref:Uncharacterized protein n=1 Tax=Solanum verrucosum TaxID=315347 RepID=A0AAF0U1H1_SOLVR|nr:hypothetical protein MTR67_030908 [Solanum verrucosum]